MPTYVERLEDMKLEEIWKEVEGETPSKDPTVYTSSMLTSLDQCEQQYRFQYIDGARPEFRTPQMVRGSALHRSIDTLHREERWTDWADIFRQNWEILANQEEDADLPWRSEIEDEKLDSIVEDGVTILGGYVAANQGAKVIATEVPFRMLIEHPRTHTRYRFAGTIDQLRESDEMTAHNQTPGVYVPDASTGWLEIWDMKSDAAAPDAAYLERNTQLTSYGLALAKGRLLVGNEWQPEHGKFPNRVVWYQLHHLLPYKRAGTRKDGTKYVKGDPRGNPVYAVSRKSEDYLDFQAELCRKIQKVRMGLLTRNVQKIGCTMCRFRNACTSGLFVRHESLMEAADLSGL